MEKKVEKDRKYRKFLKKYSVKTSKKFHGLLSATKSPKRKGIKFGRKSMSQSRKTGKVGRPAMVYKHRHPVTGKPIPAQVYNKVMRRFRAENRARREMMSQQMMARHRMQMARRGIPPEQSQIMIQRARLAHQAQMETQPQQVQQAPQQLPQEQGYRVVTDIMTGRKRLEPVAPPEKWTRQQEDWVRRKGILLR